LREREREVRKERKEEGERRNSGTACRIVKDIPRGDRERE